MSIQETIISLILGDRNALLIAARILAYGSQYSFEYKDIEEDTKEEQKQPLTFKKPASTSDIIKRAQTFAKRQLDEGMIKTYDQRVGPVDTKQVQGSIVSQARAKSVIQTGNAMADKYARYVRK